MTTRTATVTAPDTAPGTALTPVSTRHRTGRLLADRMAALASWRLWLGCAVAFVVSAGVFFASSAPFAIPRVEALCRQAPPDVRFAPSAADVIGFLDACGAAGRDAYRFLQVADLLYPVVFGMFLATSMALVLARVRPARRAVPALAVLPLIGSAFDYLENVCAWLALAAYPAQSPAGSLFGLASAAKNLTLWTSGALLVAALGMLVLARTRRPLRPQAEGASLDGRLESH